MRYLKRIHRVYCTAGVIIYNRIRESPLELVEGPGVGEYLPAEPPHVLGRALQRRRSLTLEQVQMWDEVVRAPAALQARDELQKYAVDAVRDTSLLPLGVPWVFLALVQQQRLDVIIGDRVTGQIEVPVPESLEDAQTSLSAAAV